MLLPRPFAIALGGIALGVILMVIGPLWLAYIGVFVLVTSVIYPAVIAPRLIRRPLHISTGSLSSLGVSILDRLRIGPSDRQEAPMYNIIYITAQHQTITGLADKLTEAAAEQTDEYADTHTLILPIPSPAITIQDDCFHAIQTLTFEPL